MDIYQIAAVVILGSLVAILFLMVAGNRRRAYRTDTVSAGNGQKWGKHQYGDFGGRSQGMSANEALKAYSRYDYDDSYDDWKAH